MELSDYIRILRKNWLGILALTLIGLIAAAAFSLTRTPMYQGESVVFVQSQAGTNIGEQVQGSNFAQSRITTYSGLVREPVVMTPVIESLQLDVTTTELAERVTVSNPAGSTLIHINAQDADPVRAAEISNALSASLAATVERIDTPPGDDSPTVMLTPVREALAPNAPISPNVPLNLALGVLVGLAIGLGLAVLRSVLDNKVRSPRDIEEITDRPIIGSIPDDPKAKQRPLLVHQDPLNPRAEAFRALRTNLQFMELDGGHSYVVTSSIPSEGKSTTSLNLALALADSGKSVALIDTDLRKPKIATYLGVEGGAGLTDLLIGKASVDDVLLQYGKTSLHVLPAGRIPPNPSELLGSKRMQRLIEVLGQEFDVVLCDAPPLLPVTDAAVLSRSLSGAIVVVSVGRTTTQQVDAAFDVLEASGAKVAGIVMTMVPTRGADASAYGGYGYYGEYSDNSDQKQAKKGFRGRRAPGIGVRRTSGNQPENASLDEIFTQQ